MIKRRKNQQRLGEFWWKLPYVLLTIMWWGLLWLTFIYVDPVILKDVLWPETYLPFFILLFLATSFTIVIFFKKLWRGLIWAGAITGFFYLKMMKMGHVVNAMLIGGLLLALEYYFRPMKLVSDRKNSDIDKEIIDSSV